MAINLPTTLHYTSSLPQTPIVGSVYCDASTNQLMIYDGTNWLPLATNVIKIQPSFKCYETSSGEFVVDATQFDIHNIFTFHDYLRKKCTDRYTVQNNYFYFKYEKDRTMFILKFG